MNRRFSHHTASPESWEHPGFTRVSRWFLATMLSLLWFAASAQSQAAAPTVASPTSANVTQAGATLGGNVTSDGGAAITERGVVYAKTASNSNPLVGGANVTKVTATGTTGVFTISASALATGTGYSYKAYAINAQGTSYSAVATFRTLGSFTNGSFEINGGNGSAVATGWTFNPAHCEVLSNQGTAGSFGIAFNGANQAADTVLSQTFLTVAGQTYKVSFDYGGGGVAGMGIGVNVLDGGSPSGSTQLINTGSGQLTAGTSGVTMIENTTTIRLRDFDDTYIFGQAAPNARFGVVSFTFTAQSGVSTLVFVDQSAATNAVDTFMDNVVVGVAPGAAAPMIQPDAVSTTYSDSTNVLGRTINQSGLTATYTEGVTDFATFIASAPTHGGQTANVWYGNGTSGTVTFDLGSGYKLSAMAFWAAGPEALGEFTMLASNDPTFATSTTLGYYAVVLQGSEGARPPQEFHFPETTARYVRLNVTSQPSANTVSMGEVAFKGTAALTVSAPTSASITTTTATLGGNVTSDGGDAVTERGVVLAKTSENSDPSIGGANVTKMSTTGTTGIFTVDVTGLAVNTAYSFKAYATNGQGTSYTLVGTFTTLTIPIPVTTIGFHNISGVVGNYYNGGAGPNVGILFNSTNAASGGILSGAGNPIISVPNGFTTGFSVEATNVSIGFSINIYSGENGTGTLLASRGYDLNGSITGSVTFSGMAKSVVLAKYSGGPNYDNLTFGSSTIGTPVVEAPGVATSAATSIGSTTVTLNGSVNPGGVATTAQFEYGTTTSYGSTATVTLSPNDGTSGQVVNTALTGLTPSTTYHFRLTATNSAGTQNGSDLTFTTAAPAAYALHFDGTNDVVDIPHAAGQLSYPFTVEAWVKTTDADGIIVSKYVGGSGNGWQMGMGGGKLTAWFFRPGGAIIPTGSGIVGATSINNNIWHHVAFVVDATGGRLFVDGVSDGFSSWTSGTPGPATTTVPVRLGNETTGSLYPWAGTLDEVRIWSTARSAADILASKDSELAVMPPCLVGYYKFNQGTIGGNNAAQTTVADYTGGPAGTLLSFALTGSTSNYVAGSGITEVISVASTSDPEIGLEGNATPIVLGDSTPSTTDGTEFGSWMVGNFITQTFTVKNTGSADLNVSSIAVSGTNAANFTLGSLTPASPVPANSSATFTVTFTPSAVGLRTATVTVINNDCNESAYSFAVQGTGTNTAPSVAATNATVTVNEGTATSNALTISDAESKVTTVTADVGSIGVLASATYVSEFATTSSPRRFDFDSAGNIYVGNLAGVVTKYDPSGNQLMQFTIASPSVFNDSENFTGIDVDAAGNIYVTYSGHTHTRKYDSSGNLIGNFGPATQQVFIRGGRFGGPSGNYYQLDRSHKLVLVNPSGTELWRTSGYNAGVNEPPNTGLNGNVDVAIHPTTGAAYVADFGFIKGFDVSGATTGYFNTSGGLNNSIDMDAQGNLWAANTTSIRKFTTAGIALGSFGTTGTGAGQFQNVSYIRFDAAGNLWVLDQARSKLIKFNIGQSSYAWLHTPADGPLTQTVTITATDSAGATGTTTFDLNVNNVAPSATFSRSAATVNENITSTPTVSFTSQVDPGTTDVSTGLKYSYDYNNDGTWDDGDGTYAGSLTAATKSIPASYFASPAPSPLVVKGRIIDKDGGSMDYTVSIAINHAPTAINGPLAIVEDFDYGITAGTLNGNGGSGFSTAWTGGGYTPTGLSLGSLSSIGGAWNGGSGSRNFASTLAAAGPISGDFLFSMSSAPSGRVQMFGLGGTNNQVYVLGLAPANDSTPTGGVPIVGLAGGGYANITSGPVALNTTYMYRFSYAGSSITAWILNAAQYANFAPGGMLDADLNAASIGTGATQVVGRVTKAGNVTGNMANLFTYTFGGSGVTMDRLRITGQPVGASLVIAENAAINTNAGTLLASDADASQTITYTLVSGTGDTDNAKFNISGSTLRNSVVFDYETQQTASIRVRATDQGGLFYETALTVTVSNVNEAVTDIALTPSSIAENNTANATVGTLSATGLDVGDTYTFTLVSGTGSTDNTSFTIVGSDLKLIPVADFETKSSYALRVRATDTGGLYVEKELTVTITNVNEAPTSLSAVASGGGTAGIITWGSVEPFNADPSQVLTNGIRHAAISFNTSADRVVNGLTFDRYLDGGAFANGSLISCYPSVEVRPFGRPSSDAYSALLDNAGYVYFTPRSFSINGLTPGQTYQVQLFMPFWDNRFPVHFGTAGGPSVTLENGAPGHPNPDTVVGTFVANSSSLTVSWTQGNGTHAGLSAISVRELTLSVAENNAVGATIATLSTNDPDGETSFTYSLVSGAGDTGNAAFTIDGDLLKAAVAFNYEAQNSYSLRVRATDAGGAFVEKIVSVSITDGPEAPIDVTLSSASIAENNAAEATVGTLSALDDDMGDTHTFTLVSGTGSTDNASFTIVGSDLKLIPVADFETKSSYALRVRATDTGGLFFEKELTVTITNVNETPVITANNATVSTVAGQLATNSGTYSDPDGDDVTLTASHGTITKVPATPLQADTATGGFWRTSTVVKPLDADGNNIYGSDGYAMWGLDGVETIVNPAYATVTRAAGLAFFPGQGGYTYIDDPANPLGAKKLTGVIYNGPGDNQPTTFFSVAFTQACTVRMGVLVDNADFIAISPTTLRLRQTAGGTRDTGHLTAGTEATRNHSTDWYFFDIAAQPGDVYELSGLNDPGFGSNGIGGVTFDTGGSGGASGSGTWTWTYTPTSGPSSSTVTVTATDTATPQLSGTASFTLDVTNSTPTDITLGGAVPSVPGVATWSPISLYNNVPAQVLTNGTRHAAVVFDFVDLTENGLLFDGHIDAGTFRNGSLISTNPPGHVGFITADYGQLVRYGGFTTDTNGFIDIAGLTVGATYQVQLFTPYWDSPFPSIISTAGGPSVTLECGYDTHLPQTIVGTFTAAAATQRINWGMTTSHGGLAAISVRRVAGGLSIAENNAIGDTITTLGAIDADAGDTFTYSLVSGTGSEDNAAFSLVGNQLKAAVVFDYETKATYTLRVRATDASGAFVEKALTVSITDVAEFDYLITNVGGVLTITGGQGGTTTNDEIFINESGANEMTISATGRIFSPAGPIPLTGITQIIFDAGSGNDIINVGDFPNTLMPSLTINGNAGNDTVNLNGSIHFADGSNLDLNLQNDTATPGIDSLVLGTHAELLWPTDATGNADIKVTRNIELAAGSSLQLGLGSITLEANQQATPTTGDFIGVSASDATIFTQGAGAIIIKGKGGNADTASATNPNAGIALSGTEISQQGAGNLVLQGTSVANGDGAAGISIVNSNTTSNGGDVELTGVAAGTGSGDNRPGIVLGGNLGSDIVVSGDGNLTVAATGAPGDGNGNAGIVLGGTAVLQVENGDVILLGQGGAGTSGTTGLNRPGLLLLGHVTATGTGNIVIDGTAGISSTPQDGVALNGSELNGGGSVIETTSGDVSITGTPSGTGNSIALDSSGAPLITTEEGGSVTLIGDKITLVDSTASGIPAIQSSGPLSFLAETLGAPNPIVLDGSTLALIQGFTITINNVLTNSAPTALTLSATTLVDGDPIGAVVGTLAGTDADLPAQTLAFGFASGPGSEDNSSFEITGNTLKSASVLELATQSTYHIRLVVTDGAGGAYEKAFEITLVPLDYQITLNAGVLSITDLVGHGDTLALDEAGANALMLSAAGRTFRTEGNAATTESSSAVSLNGVTLVSLNAADGMDTINVGDFPFTLFPSLILMGGNGNDIVNLNGSIHFADGASLAVDLQNDTPTPGTDRIVVGSHAELDFPDDSTGSLIFTASRNIELNQGSSIEVGLGTILLEANLQAIPTTGDFSGVEVTGATISTQGSGAITIKGKGGDSTTNPNTGITFFDTEISQQGAGNLVLQGVSVANANGSAGVIFDNSNVQTNGGNVSLTGSATGSGSGDDRPGVLLTGNLGAEISVTAAGTLSVTAIGAPGNGNGNAGLIVEGTGSLIVENGALSVTATGGQGTSGTTGDDRPGMLIFGHLTSTGTGDISIDATAGVSSTPQNGVTLNGSELNGGGSVVETASGNVSITGTPSGTGNSIALDSSGAPLITTEDGGSVAFIGDVISIVDSSASGIPAIQSSGPLTFTVETPGAPSPITLDAPTFELIQGFTVIVNNTLLNSAPTSLALSSTNVFDGTASGTTIATLSATDADLPAQTLSFGFASGPGSADNAAFTIVGNALKPAADLNFIDQAIYNIRVVVTDNAGGAYEKAFTITVVAPDYNVTLVGSVLTISDLTGHSDTLAIDEASPNAILFSTPGRTFRYDYGTFTTDNSGSISLVGVTSIIINSAEGDDVINVGDFPHTLFPSLTINGGDGNDTINLNGSIHFAAGSNLDLDLQNDTPTPGIDQVTLGTHAQLIWPDDAAGDVDIKVSRNITLPAGSSIEVGLGSTSLEANQQSFATVGDFIGISVDGASISSEGNGSITLKGRGGNAETDTANMPNAGISLFASTISMEGSGTLVLQGTSVANGDNAAGIAIENSNATTNGGNMELTGMATGTGSGDNRPGIVLGGNLGSRLETSGSGDLSLVAVGAPGSGDGNAGIVLHGTSTVIVENGDLELVGQGGQGSTVTVGDDRPGLIIQGHVTSTGTGDIIVDGTAGTSSTPQAGVSLEGSELNGGGSVIETNSGNVIVGGTPTGGGSSLALDSSGAPLITTEGGGNVVLEGDLISILDTSGSGVPAISTSGFLEISVQTLGAPTPITLDAITLSLIQSGTLIVNQTTTNVAPATLTLAPVTVAENNVIGATVGTLSATDNDLPAQTLSFGFASGPGAEDNASFTITGNLLKAAVSLDYETQSAYNVRLSVSDGFGGTLEKAFVVNISDVADTPIQVWRSLNFPGLFTNTGNAANNADPDGDTFSNLLEFAFGTDPNDSASGPGYITFDAGAITLRGQPKLTVTNARTGVDFRAHFGRRKDYVAAELIYKVQFSADLQTWVDGTTTPTVDATDAELEAVSVKYPFFLPDGRKARYHRVQVSIP